MADRVKRSVSMPPEVDAAIAAAAAADGLTYSAWLAREAGRALRLRDGLAAMAEYEAEHGAFTDEELASAQRWVDEVLAPLPADDAAVDVAVGRASPSPSVAAPRPTRSRRRSTPAA